MKSQMLQWIADNRQLLRIMEIEKYVGIPKYCLHKYLDNGYMPPKWIPVIEKKMSKLLTPCHLELINYIRKLIETHVELVNAVGIESSKRKKASELKHTALNAKQEQVLDDLVILHHCIYKATPHVASVLRFELSTRQKSLSHHLTEIVEKEQKTRRDRVGM